MTILRRKLNDVHVRLYTVTFAFPVAMAKFWQSDQAWKGQRLPLATSPSEKCLLQV
jgi:hypothetical protein